MKNRYIKILQSSPLYDSFDLNANEIQTLLPNTIMSFNREKRRNGINWLEVNMEDGSVAYIRKKTDGFFICQYAKLEDEYVTGMYYKQKTPTVVPINMLFFPDGYHSNGQNEVKKITLESTLLEKSNKKTSLTLEYFSQIVDVEKIKFRKGDMFYITNRSYKQDDVFMEVDNFKGKQGIVLKKTTALIQGSKWIDYLLVISVIVTVLVIFYALLSKGLIVVGGFMIVLGIIAAFISYVFLMIVKELFQLVYKRF